ncbi:general secretion pathway protein GspB [Malonomonas rubra]|uniref:general secretion pathway protein GspB n=1 Tax=Malonomonas rubra TaxID=57040 RepID=UPI0026F028EC|nr:general secretion pathway protein GspB [Malonomonas rubra]
MSFILDALRKSDKKRQDGNVPNLVTSHHVPADSGARRPLWGWLLLPVLMLNAVILLWLFGPWSQPDQSVQLQVAPANSVEKKSPEEPVTSLAIKASSPAMVRELLPKPIHESPQLVTAAVTEPQPRAEAVAEAVKQIDSAPLQEQLAPTDAEIVGETQGSRDLSSLVEQAPRLYNLSDLPPAVRRDIPEMHISLHAYFDDAQQRLVSINNKLLREGGLLDGKYFVEEITLDGVIFSYAGYRFQVLFKSSRS